MKPQLIVCLALNLSTAITGWSAPNNNDCREVFSNTAELPGASSIVFKDCLYAGYSRLNGDPAAGAQIWRSPENLT